MSSRIRWLMLLTIALVIVGGAGAYAVASFIGYQDRQSAPSPVDVTATGDPDGPRIVFRNTAAGSGYGLVASVALDDPDGPRAVSNRACDRVDQTEKATLCLRTNRGIVTTFEAVLFDHTGAELDSWPLPGVPSRTRISPDSTLFASTSFITGMSYATVGFSTQTVIRSSGGQDYGNLEDFVTTIDGTRLQAADRNFWGVTFAADGNTFYATAASAGSTWLVRGDLAARSLTSVKENAECPSLSPDGLRIAYKKNVSPGAEAHWAVAILDLATGSETVLGEERSVDDQIEWLDDDTILYGLTGETPGDSDVWALGVEEASTPQVFIPHAWSPAVIP